MTSFDRPQLSASSDQVPSCFVLQALQKKVEKVKKKRRSAIFLAVFRSSACLLECFSAAAVLASKVWPLFVCQCPSKIKMSWIDYLWYTNFLWNFVAIFCFLTMLWLVYKFATYYSEANMQVWSLT